MRILRVSYHVKGFVSLGDYALRLAYMITEKAKHRIKVLAFWEKHGLEAALDAFPAKRSTLFLWKRKLRKGRGRLEALNDISRAPKKRRKRLWPHEIIDEIKRLRTLYPNLGKDKVYPLPYEFSSAHALKRPASSTIGRLIRDCGGLRMFPQKITHAGKILPAKRKKVLRKPKNFRAVYPGHLVALDTIERFVQGYRRYIITFEDISRDLVLHGLRKAMRHWPQKNSLITAYWYSLIHFPL